MLIKFSDYLDPQLTKVSDALSSDTKMNSVNSITIPDEVKQLAKETEIIVSSAYFNNTVDDQFSENKEDRNSYRVYTLLFEQLSQLLSAIMSSDSLSITEEEGLTEVYKNFEKKIFRDKILFKDKNDSIIYTGYFETLRDFGYTFKESEMMFNQDVETVDDEIETSATLFGDWFLQALNTLMFS